MKEGVFDKLREQLEQEQWPNAYMFKFIVPNTPEHIAKVYALFGEEAMITEQPSRNGKYMSISAKELMLNVDSIMKIYEESTKIEGLISL
jgi:uncharacterized protein